MREGEQNNNEYYSFYQITKDFTPRKYDRLLSLSYDDKRRKHMNLKRISDHDLSSVMRL